MTIELNINPILLGIIERLAALQQVPIEIWIHENLEKATHNEQKESVYRMWLEGDI